MNENETCHSRALRLLQKCNGDHAEAIRRIDQMTQVLRFTETQMRELLDTKTTLKRWQGDTE